MDMQMPVVGGLEATQIIRVDDDRNGRHTPIVAMTANAMPEDKQRCLNAGMDDYIAKPLNTEQLRALLQSITLAKTNQGAVNTAAADESSQTATTKKAEFDYADALNKADEWVVETIGHEFLTECDVQMAAIRSAIQDRDNELLLRAAHTLRGLVGNFHAKPVAEIARLIEHLPEPMDSSQATDLFGNLEVELNKLKLALISYLAN
jgi:CheY-like chemotaxis protein